MPCTGVPLTLNHSYNACVEYECPGLRSEMCGTQSQCQIRRQLEATMLSLNTYIESICDYYKDKMDVRNVS